MEGKKEWILLLEGASLDREGEEWKLLGRKLGRLGPLAVETSRAQSCLRSAATLSAKLGCKLIVNADWDPDQVDSRGDDLLLEGDPLDYFLSQYSADYHPPSPFPPSTDFTTRLLSSISSLSALPLLIIAPASVVATLVSNIGSERAESQCVFAVVTKSPLSVHFQAKTVKEIDDFNPMFDGEKSTEPISVRLTALLNRDLAHSVADPIHSFQSSLRPVTSLHSLGQAEQSLNDLKARMEEVGILLEKKITQMNDAKSRQNSTVIRMIQELRDIVKRQDEFQSHLLSSVDFLLSSATSMSLEIASKSAESRQLQAEVSALSHVPAKPLPIDITHVMTADDGGQVIGVASRKHYQLYVVVEIAGDSGMVKKDYKTLAPGYQVLKISDPGDLPSDNYHLSIKSKDKPKVISNVVEFHVQLQAPRRDAAEEWDYRESFLYKNTANIQEVEGALAPDAVLFLRRLALSWRNPSSDLIEPFLNILLAEPINRIQTSLEARGFQFDAQKLAYISA